MAADPPTVVPRSQAPQMLGSKVGMSTKSQDAEFDELHRKFTGLEGAQLLCARMGLAGD